MLLTEACGSVDLDVGIRHDLVWNRHLPVKNIIVTRSIEKMNDRTTWIRRNAILIFRLKHMAIDL